MIRARVGLVRALTALVNTPRGLVKSYGERLRGCNVRNMNPEKGQALSPELQDALQPLRAAIESLSERSEQLAQVKLFAGGFAQAGQRGGHADRAEFLLALEDPHRFCKSRDVGCYLGMQIAALTLQKPPVAQECLLDHALPAGSSSGGRVVDNDDESTVTSCSAIRSGVRSQSASACALQPHFH